MIIAILAVLKAGKFYVPLDPAYPAPRLAVMLADSQTRLVITRGSPVELWARLKADSEPAPPSFLDMMMLDPELSVGNPPLSASSEGMFNLIYTSGSTGKPKGVLQTHRNVLFDTHASTQHFALNANDRFALIVPCTFGASASDIFGALLNGAALCLLDVKKAGLDRLGAWLREEAITIYHSVPTVFRQFMALVGQHETFPAMRLIKLGGETLLRQDVALFQAHFSHRCRLRNSLGSTEAYMATYHLLGRDSPVEEDVIPVGQPAAGRKILILDEAGRELPPGKVGQIVVKSRYLSPGYWLDPEGTAAAFRDDPQGGGEARLYFSGDLGRKREDGCLEHLGRLDDMIKIQGQRVEPGEVEAALLDLDPVREAVVVLQPGPAGEDLLVAYLVAVVHPPPTSSTLRESLAARLPHSMIPSAFIWLERLPLLPFGKVNRNALPAPEWKAAVAQLPYTAPRTDTEQTLVRIWAGVLGLSRREDQPGPGVQDNFFDLGGSSLSAVRVIGKIRENFQVDISQSSFFEQPTIAGQAALIDKAQVEGSGALETTAEEDLGKWLSMLESF